METLLADVRHSFRILIKSPGFTIVAVLALALGIGANTAIFSVIDRVLLAPLPFPESERIMRVERKFPNGNGTSVSIPKFMAWKKNQNFQSMAAYDFGGVSLNLGTGDRPNPVNGMHVTSGFFNVFGVAPMGGVGVRVLLALSPGRRTPSTAPKVFTQKSISAATSRQNSLGMMTEAPSGIPFTVLAIYPPTSSIESCCRVCIVKI